VRRNGLLTRWLGLKLEKSLEIDVRVLSGPGIEQLGIEIVPLRNPVQLERQDFRWET
jgi:hypothetical protein